MSTFISTATAYVNFVRQLRGFLHNTISYDEIHDKISQQIINREDNFLKMPSARLAQSQFRDGDVIGIRRTQPLRTSRGKHSLSER
jgi:hypothetical protein